MAITNIKGPPGPTGDPGQQGPQGVQGPEGPQGATGSFVETVYAKRYQIVSDTFFYRGEAVPASISSDPVWRIWTVTISGGVAVIAWAGGTSNFDKVWDSRGSYTYL